VGPVWSGGGRGEPELLANCYRNSLRLATGNGLRSIAFPAISCGVYRYPVADAVKIAVREVRAHLASGAEPQQVIFACFGEEMLAAYQAALL
jgi:O-acetyl-ADP-ribose deacetylase (regulator of RNase III)